MFVTVFQQTKDWIARNAGEQVLCAMTDVIYEFPGSLFSNDILWPMAMKSFAGGSLCLRRDCLQDFVLDFESPCLHRKCGFVSVLKAESFGR